MKQVRNILMTTCWAFIVIALAAVAIFESETLPTGLWQGNANAEFFWRCAMEILTPLGVYLSLRLFRFKKIQADLFTFKTVALQRWGMVRLLLLLAPMLTNTLLYYMYHQTTYAYLAIISLLAMPFVYPTMQRCVDDVTPEEDTIEDRKEDQQA